MKLKNLKKAKIKEERSIFVTTRSGETKVLSAEPEEIPALEKTIDQDPAIKAAEDSTGKKLKEGESDIALNMDYVGKTLTDLFADFLRDIGEEISEINYTIPSGQSHIKVKATYKEGTDKDYTFQLKGNQLLLDGTFLMELNRLPSGEIQIPKETLNSALYKYFENQMEFSDMNLAESAVADREGNTLRIGDKIQVGKLIFEIGLDSEKNLVFLKTGNNRIDGGTKAFKTLLENCKKYTENILTESVEVGDKVKISKAYGGGKGVVVDKRGSFIVLDNGESYHEADVINISRKLGEDIDVGHIDDEPGMLLQTAYETAVHAANIYKQLKHYESHNQQIDFPNWWQSKVILGKDYIAKADKWLEFATQEGQFLPEQKKK
jgi:hypothetical protein